MRYTVLWSRDAEGELATAWLGASNRAAVATAARIIDDALHENPSQVGESRTRDRRILIVAPLGVIFEIVPQDRIVRVLKVWRFGTHE